jgi:hypothetical protein
LIGVSNGSRQTRRLWPPAFSTGVIVAFVRTVRVAMELARDPLTLGNAHVETSKIPGT